MKKQDKNKIEFIDGQISIFDLKITEKPKKVTKIEVSVTKSNDLTTENKESFTNIAVEITQQQQKVIDKFKATQIVNRIIIYAKGSIGIEVKEAGFTTHYISREGKEEFCFNAKSPVLPWDKIIYYMQEKVPLVKEQVDKLQALLSKRRDDIKRVLHRKGDENLLVECGGRIISILANGWQIEFKSKELINCEDDEVYLIPNKIDEEVPKDPTEIQQKVKVGDCVQAMYGKKLIEGIITRVYGFGNNILNISFENSTIRTAIGRRTVRKILKSS